MLAVLAFLSDIPTYIAALISELTNSDISAILDVFNFGIRDLIEAIENFLIK